MRGAELNDDLLRRAIGAEPPADETAERILGAALDQAEDFGLRRFTIDDVARRVRLSRVTIYRYFPKKDQLLNAVLMYELRRFLTKVDAVIAAQPTPEAKLTEGLIFCLKFVRGHRLLNRLLRTEPEFTLPYLTVKAGGIIAACREWISGHIRAEIAAGRVAALPDQDVEGLSELIVRVVISLALTPETVLPIDDADGWRRAIDLYVTPVVRMFHPRA